MKTTIKLVMASFVLCLLAIAAFAGTTPDIMHISCTAPKPDPQTGLHRPKGDGNVWTFKIALDGDAHFVKGPYWRYPGKDGGDPDWGIWLGGADGDSSLGWSSPGKTGAFSVRVSGQITCGNGNGGGGKPIDFEAGWDGDVKDYKLTVESDKSNLCAGGINSSVHQAKITIELKTLEGDPANGETVSLETIDSVPEYPSTLSSTAVTTDENGEATVTLTSSRKIDSTTKVKATYKDEVEAETDEIKMQAPDDSWDIDPQTLMADGESTADVSITLTFNGKPVDGHHLTWRIGYILDANNNEVYTADPSFGSTAGYGNVDGNGDVTDENGYATTIYTAGTEAGTVDLQALDDTVVMHSPAVYDAGDVGGLLYPTKIDVKQISTSGTTPIVGFPNILYKAAYDSNGNLQVQATGNPVLRRMNANFNSHYALMCWPANRSMDPVTVKYTWKIQKDGVVKKQGSEETSGSTGSVSVTTPNTVGIYDLKHYVTIKQFGSWKGSLDGETSELFSTYQTPISDSQRITRDNLRRVVGIAQNTNDLSKNGQFSVPYKLHVAFNGHANYKEGTGYNDDQRWQMIQGNLNGDCDDWARAHVQALSLLGISASPLFVQRTGTSNGIPIRLYFSMIGSDPSKYWNYHCVSQVDGGYCYSLTQAGLPVGTWQEMNADPPDPSRLVINQFSPSGWQID